MKNSKIFKSTISVIVSAITIASFFFACHKENELLAPSTEKALQQSGCEQLATTPYGYIVESDGVLNFRNPEAIKLFLASIDEWSDNTFAAWEASNGANTAYGNYIEVENAQIALMSQYENTTITDAQFLPIWNNFVQNNSGKANVLTEGIEPLFSFPFYYFVNGEGIYRICDREYSVNGHFLFSYPVGEEELIEDWNGSLGSFGDLTVESLQNSSETVQVRNEYEEESNTTTAPNNSKKRIKVIWESEAWREPYTAPNGNVSTAYHWWHQAQTKGQKKSAFIWWPDKRHISLAVDGSITNRHQHESIGFSITYSDISYFKCDLDNKLKKQFAPDVLLHGINNDANNFAYNLTIMGTNRTSNCTTVQYTCTLPVQDN